MMAAIFGPASGLPIWIGSVQSFLLCKSSHNRKNYLFLGSDSGGERAASLYSIIATAKLNGLDPAFYLRTVLARIPEHLINRIEELLPWALTDSLQIDSQAA
jgi:transposase